MGTIANAIAILIGGCAGLLVKRGISEKVHETVMQALGLGVLFIGSSSAIKNILVPGSSSVLFIVSLALGGLVGGLLSIESRLDSLGTMLENKVARGDANFAQGFVSATLLFCVGTMAIIGSIESGAYGDNTTLYAKAVIDGITAIMLASTLGFGVLFSAIAVLVYQGLLTFVATLISPYLTDQMLVEIGIIGGILIAALGFNMLKISKIKVANMLPAVLVPVLYFALRNIIA